jgi:fructose/tagatose bisphosphate aldolase
MHTLLNALEEADRAHIAIGHFNISESVSLTAVAAAARELNVPVIVGLSAPIPQRAVHSMWKAELKDPPVLSLSGGV